MKKVMSLLFVIIFVFVLAGCDYSTTNTTQETTTVDTENLIDISNADELMNIELNKSYRLINNIDLTGIEWEPIGSYNEPFMGIFDGNGYTISNLTISDKNSYLNGLFAYVTGEVKNLTLQGVSIDYSSDFITYAGAIAGINKGDLINNEVDGSIQVLNTDSNTYAGLLAGMSSGVISDKLDDFSPNLVSSNKASGSINVSSAAIAFIGGMIGKSYNSTIDGNIANTNVTVEALGDQALVYVGGLIGHNYGGILIDNGNGEFPDTDIFIENNISISTLNISNSKSNIFIGGFIGFNQASELKNNFSNADIVLTGTKEDENSCIVGGFVGENFEAKINSNVVIINSLDTADFTKEVQKDAFVGGDYSDYSSSDIYIYNPMNIDLIEIDNDITILTSQDITDETFYRDYLNWDENFYTLIIDNLDID
ncbi:MAG: hypothetical protein B6I17_01215 [Tenericutes bacterium 4572_104]|nr:MAG: hypothetical protein B6I17_01215 [Tenericutes bacterium 4572_104]